MNCHMDSNTTYLIARFNEDISWTNELDTNRVILNKGRELEPMRVGLGTILNMQNVGRESESYLRYVVENYESLPNVIVFSQGDISDHSVYGTNDNDPQKLRRAGKEALENGWSSNFVVSNNLDVHSGTCHSWNFREHFHYWFEPNSYETKVFFGDWFEDTFGIPLPSSMPVFWAGIFAIRRDKVHAHPKAFYEAFLAQLQWSCNPIQGHFFERSWWYVFCG